ncbi:breast cancer type 1 susceptibility protein homolog isoform X1 [Gambusia affinis]|uniref:breast cancer type 1 susceptibility protein homolog isoform X1 n=1 Tax=Gambusia affinis TaxID=33528 RepID=UPI001CDC0B02|nr:breast cancer type 1 susceptibility protein homolog isoform X1 [Gambusia affinis]XP_043957853.1 breast cancer type 1 susceptibility protein homolog isoform X1 [Gambusia affinis]XP_043957854.1 breast cancer type 1 susceptibility protein homolog isoform X1 [Gambusia affinis]
MTTPKATDVKKGISVLWETLQCPICLDLMSAPVSTKCDHQFCKFCITKLLDNSKQNRANCPVCKFKITKRSLQESPGFQRLVAGLQEMIQAYEHDTCTNYFTGLPQQRKNTKNTETSKGACDLSFGDPSGIEQNNKGTEHRNDSPQSCSSTVAAQNGFAQLMGLEDSASITAENEGLDSGLGDVPPTSDKKTSENLEPETANVGKNATNASKNKRLKRKPEKASNCLDSTQEEPGQQDVRKSSRKTQKKDLEHDKIIEQKKKKSLEKVAEWLLKVPAEDELELEKSLHSEDDSDSSSSTSILDDEPQNVKLNPKREHRGKAIEEQVFGVIYKRRGSKVTEPLTAEEIETCNKFSKLKKKNNVRLCEERQIVENNTGSDFFEELEQMAVKEKLEETVEELSQKESDKYEGEHVVPVADIIQPETTTPRRRTRKSLQQPEGDLQEQTQLKSKDTDKKSDCRREKNSKLSRKKPTKVAKPLVLVEVQDRETSPKPSERVKEVEVQIESYPSSEEQTTPVMKNARRSRRLQLFVDEVHGSRKKTTSKVTATKTDEVAKKQSDETMDATPSKSGNLMKETKRNRYVSEENIGVIESLEKRGRMSLTQAEAEVPEAQTLAKPDCTVSVVPNSTSPTDPSIVGPTLESEKQENNHPPGSQQEAFANVEEYEDGKNDSELDTEQLLQSFKASKRKSFLLGDPNAKRCRSLDVENAEGSQRNCSSSEPSENINQVSKSTCSDVISPSNSPSKIRKPDQALLDASNPDGNCPSRSSVSSGLSPNKVAKHDRDSPLSVVPQVVDSGLRFTDVEQEAARASQSDYNLTEIPDGISKCPSDNKTETIFVGESSLTPDQEVKEANGSGEVSTQSSIQTNQKKKRKTRRLESSSESSSSSKEELPTLAQIFGTSDRPQAEIKHQGEICEANRLKAVGEEPLGRPAGSPTPDQLDSSQASVDLFGTPEECDAPESCVGVCFDSSQFSSEVLVTQQKIEMQKELVRLEKLMALVSEVLQEKEGSPAADTNQGCENRGPELEDQDQVQSSDRKDILDAETKAPDDKVAECGGFSANAVQDLTHAESTVKDTKTPNSISATKKAKTCDSPPDCQEDKENNSPPKEKSKAKLVLVSSGLGPNEQIMVKKFAKRVGGRVVSRVTPEVTHIIMRTDDQLVCERTLKYFLGIAGRKWVVSFQWISECFKEKKLLEESSFEVRGDVVNGPNHQGPLRARTAGGSNLLMRGYKICFKGPFTDMSTDEMEWMVELCGATVVKDPLILDGEQKSHHIVIVQPRSDSPSSSSCCGGLSRNATVVTRGWLLDSVATYTLQNFSSYTV